jgi:hypothetical protein
MGSYHTEMDKNLFEVLLYQNESETLDFKEDQYAFDGATDIQKCELLKDILAFANSWRRDDAYILIGVREVRGGRSVVCGTSSHLLNRNLQQFVNSKINRPITFSYAENEFEGHKVGILAVPIQDRPFFLMKDYGRLKAKTVYVRRGDTTDEASPDEIYKMGSVVNRPESRPTLQLAFADLQKRSELGTEFTLDCKLYNLPKPDSIPDYGRQPAGPFGIDLHADISANYDFLRDIADFVYRYGMLQPIGFVVKNPSTVAATNVNLRFRIPSSAVQVCSKDEMPSKPSANKFANLGIGSGFHKSGVTVSRHGDFYDVRIEIGTVQPGIDEWCTEEIFVGGPHAFDLPLEMTLSADNLRFPQVQMLTIKGVVESEDLPVRELTNIAKRFDSD